MDANFGLTPHGDVAMNPMAVEHTRAAAVVKGPGRPVTGDQRVAVGAAMAARTRWWASTTRSDAAAAGAEATAGAGP